MPRRALQELVAGLAAVVGLHGPGDRVVRRQPSPERRAHRRAVTRERGAIGQTGRCHLLEPRLGQPALDHGVAERETQPEQVVGELVERAIAPGMLEREVPRLDAGDEPTRGGEDPVETRGKAAGESRSTPSYRTPTRAARAAGFQPWTTPTRMTTAGTAGTPSRASSARAPGSASMSTASNGTPHDERATPSSWRRSFSRGGGRGSLCYQPSVGDSRGASYRGATVIAGRLRPVGSSSRSTVALCAPEAARGGSARPLARAIGPSVSGRKGPSRTGLALSRERLSRDCAAEASRDRSGPRNRGGRRVQPGSCA